MKKKNKIMNLLQTRNFSYYSLKIHTSYSLCRSFFFQTGILRINLKIFINGEKYGVFNYECVCKIYASYNYANNVSQTRHLRISVCVGKELTVTTVKKRFKSW